MRKPPEQQLLKEQMLSQAARIPEQLQRKVHYSRSQNSGRTDQRAFSRHCVVSDFEGSLAKP